MIQRPHLILFLATLNSVLANYFQMLVLCIFFNIVFNNLFSRHLLSEIYALVLFFVVSLLLFSHYVVNVVNQICGYLDIYCLKINKPKTK